MSEPRKAMTTPSGDGSGMVERVARALFEKHYADKLALIRSGKVSASMSGIEYCSGGWDGQDESAKDYLREEARAAIEAMREPTATMAEAGHAAAEYYVWEGHMYSEYTQNPSTFQPEGAPICWRAMIDAALSPSKPPSS